MVRLDVTQIYNSPSLEGEDFLVFDAKGYSLAGYYHLRD